MTEPTSSVANNTPAAEKPPGQVRYQLELLALPHPDGVPAAVRMRGVLKRLLRQYGMRCVEIREVPGLKGALGEGKADDDGSR